VGIVSTANYALILNSVVDNIVVVDPATAGGADFLTLMEAKYGAPVDISAVSPSPAIGWVYQSSGAFVPPATLTTSSSTLAADGSNSATVTYTSNLPSPPSSVVFDINGVTTTETTTSGVAYVVVSASAVGPVVVRCAGLSLTMEAS